MDVCSRRPSVERAAWSPGPVARPPAARRPQDPGPIAAGAWSSSSSLHLIPPTTSAHPLPKTHPVIFADTIWVIEPHADDAFLSLGWSIRQWSQEGRHVGIVTVYTSEEYRVKETQQSAEAIGAEWHGLGHDQPASEWFGPPMRSRRCRSRSSLPR